jgi:YidC/Oxa1 family membrane protein insertase
LAVALSALVIFAYQQYLRIYYPNLGKKPPQSAAGPTPAVSESAPAPLPAPVNVPSETPRSAAPRQAPPAVVIDTPLVEAAISPLGGRLASLRLKRYRTEVGPESPPLDMISLSAAGDLPLGTVLRGKSTWSDGDVLYTTSASSLRVAAGENANLVLHGATADGIAVEKTLRFSGDSYAFGLGLKVTEPADRGFTEAGLRWTHKPNLSTARYSFHGAEALVGGKLMHWSDGDLEQGVILPDPRNPGAPPPLIHWAGYSDTYFLSALVPREDDAVRLWLKKESDEVFSEILVPIASTAKEPYPFEVYAGPKDLHALELAGHHLQRTVDLGWFSFVAEPMLRLLKLFHTFTGNYGLDVILLTVLVKLATVPLTQKSFRSMQEMQKLQPQMKRLQEKYADDRETLNKEVMELYRRHNVNPLGGCLPMIVQMPIFIGLYNALLSAVELRHAPFMLWINDLSAPDRLPPVPHPPLAVIAGTDIRIPVLTLLMGVSMLVQQRMTPQTGDPTQQRMMMLMPLVFTVMFINFPSGLALYWLVNNVLTIAQQLFLQRAAKKA